MRNNAGKRRTATGHAREAPGAALRLAVLLPALLLSAGCTPVSLPPAPPNARELAAAFGDGEAASGRSAVAPPTRLMHVYVDVSMSMRGFVTGTNAKYFETLDRLLDDAQSAGFRLAIDSFAGTVRELGSIRSAALREPSFYSGTETSFPVLFHHVAQERGKGTISVVISDLVQSGTTGDERALLSAFQEVTRANPEIKLLAFRSAFQGPYYVEGRRNGRTRLELSLDGSSLARSRPFYVLIIADGAEDIETVRRYLQPENALELNATGPALTVQKVEMGPPPAGAPVTWNVFAPTREIPPGVRRGLPRFLLSFLEIAPPPTDTTSLRLHLKVKRPPEEGEIKSPEGLRMEFRHCSFKTRRAAAVEAIDIPWEALWPAEDRMEMTLSFPRPQPQTWDAYQVRTAPGPGNLVPPPWVLDWSTLDDSLEKNGSRTLKLDVFITTLIRSIKEKIPFSEQYILLGRGD